MTPVANIDDRSSIERAYTLEQFRQDANRNSIQNSVVLHGLTLVSPPDESGAFHLQHAERQAGERDLTGYAIFLPATGCGGDLDADRAEYATFIDRVIEAARKVREVQPADERLRGFHGG
jgi:predicted TIM-barrel fold metal-dependent hydrolase